MLQDHFLEKKLVMFHAFTALHDTPHCILMLQHESNHRDMPLGSVPSCNMSGVNIVA